MDALLPFPLHIVELEPAFATGTATTVTTTEFVVEQPELPFDSVKV